MSAVNYAVVINSPASTSITFTPAGPFTAPVAAGTVLGTFTVSPAGWSGTVSPSAEVPSGSCNIVNNAGTIQLVAAMTLNAGTVSGTATANP